jgi:hypothetical protein
LVGSIGTNTVALRTLDCDGDDCDLDVSAGSYVDTAGNLQVWSTSKDHSINLASFCNGTCAP